LRVQKSKARTVVTLAAGAFEAREVRKQCVQNASCPALSSAALARVVKPNQRYGYDLIVHVGLARYLRGQQREEIRHELLEHGIALSTGTVSHLCDRFLVALEALHLFRVPELRATMQGGYPLHLDATCDRGKGGLFVSLDGWRGWVLMAIRIDSERDDYLRPLIEKTVALFGDPVAIVRDLGEGGARAVAPLRDQGIPDLVCHYHLLAAVGKNLCDTLYTSLRNLLRRSRLRTDLCTLLRDLRRYQDCPEGRFGPGRVRQELLALVLWLLEGNGTKDAIYPFRLPHLDRVRRYQQALAQADHWVPCPRSQPERRALRHLESLVARVGRDTRFDTTMEQLDKAWQAFGELREALRLTHAELPGGDTRTQPPELPARELRRLSEIEQEVEQYRTQLQQRVAAFGKQRAQRCPDAIILRYLDRYGAHLFGHPVLRDDDGAVQAVVERTNNVLEQLFGRTKQRLRRRVGRASLGRDLEQQPPQVMLAGNLEHPDYVRALCGTLDNLPAAFAGLDAELSAKVTLQRNNRDWELLRKVRALLKTHGAVDLHPERSLENLSATES
jgi:hypothetical protein